ncbi:MAG: NADH-quinone oxidoreductase subunit A [Pirellulales bacterium]|jgi:NADH-quinone oxidoreductase subunit A|nr:NADH-quinone oxidoreductase subunit A [Thermoguttaceae bacterium]MDD4785980.1 NADH-quinone oxidoreductase subunit A [Pirellulales bacterium]MDI9443775.1 NADH-quinone oxidoreductase subunit A [Planctomycetota bacterium]NLZ01048.1 NADH-quinone oxidoreductase subunit A [Pirellulaceae bacterium]
MTSTPTLITAYLALFAAVGFATIFVALLLGSFLRAKNRTAEKLESYECGEPPIGSGFAQFDLRFYVVALLFLIFDVEVALFFPWAAVFGKATQLSDPRLAAEPGRAAAIEQKLLELGAPRSALDPSADRLAKDGRTAEIAARLGAAAILDIALFFAVLMVGFAYVWRRGDLDWVRAVRAPPIDRSSAPPGASTPPTNDFAQEASPWRSA